MYGELIRKARKQKGMTQRELAHKLGISPVGIVQWEKNRRNPKFETRKKIADALDIDITELMLDDEKANFINTHGSSEERTSAAIRDILLCINHKAKLVESCGGTVTTDQKREWALEWLEIVAYRHGLSTEPIKVRLNQNLALGLDVATSSTVPKIEAPHKDTPIDEINSILSSMNEDGQDALLRHARELAKIPDYQKEH